MSVLTSVLKISTTARLRQWSRGQGLLTTGIAQWIFLKTGPFKLKVFASRIITGGSKISYMEW